MTMWVTVLGLYSGRQEPPWTRKGPHYDESLTDLPSIYIPNTLTGGEIERALKETVKSQSVVEVNQVIASPNC